MMFTNTTHFIGIFLIFTFILIFAASQLKSNLKIEPFDISVRHSSLNPKRFQERKINLEEFCKDKLHPTMPTKEDNQIYAGSARNAPERI